MNIAVYLVDREGVGQGAIQAQAEYALKSIIRRGASVGQVFVYVERDDSVPAAQRPRLTVLVEDAARRGFDRVVISAPRDLGPDPEEQRDIIAQLRRSATLRAAERSASERRWLNHRNATEYLRRIGLNDLALAVIAQANAAVR